MSESMTLEEEIRSKPGFEKLPAEHPDCLYITLLNKIREYHPASDDIEMIEKAYRLADEAHRGVLRKSGEPYIIHPVHVAIILADLHMDKESIVAGILHDVVEDTEYSKEDIQKMFGAEIAGLVDGVTKLTRIQFKWNDKEDEQAANLRKMILAMSKDIRVIIIKLADRLHNMRTMQYQTPQKQIEKSRETLEIYSPLANRLGMSKLKIELDDYALMYLMPDEYRKIRTYLDEHEPERDQFIKTIVKEVQTHLHKDLNIEANVYGRVKHIFSIYKKMRSQNKGLDQIYDLFAIRVIVNTESECYQVLGMIHDMYTPVPGRFKDYIGIPKGNGYESLHTTVISHTGEKFEVQIRTEEMHRIAEYGIAAHWKYKEVKKKNDKRKETDKSKAEIDKMAWLRELLLLQTSNEDNKEFISEIKQELNLFADRVYAFTPQGKVINLPADSTPVDFAYRIHTDVGNHMTSAIVNGRAVQLDYKIQSGDVISINTAQNAKPSSNWLSFVKSPQARTKINQWFKNQNREERIDAGRRMLEQYAASHHINLKDAATAEAKDGVARKYGYVDWNSVLAAVGNGSLTEGQVVNRMANVIAENEAEQDKEHADEKAVEMLQMEAAKIARQKAEREKQANGRNLRCGAFLIKGYGAGSGTKPDDIMIDCAHCCKPIPGDEIFGYLTRTRGIKVHRKDCPNFKNMTDDDRARIIEVSWADTGAKDMDKRDGYVAELAIYAHDRAGLIVSVAGIISGSGLNIDLFNTEKSVKGIATIRVRLTVRTPDELAMITKKLKQSPDVLDVKRV